MHAVVVTWSEPEEGVCVYGPFETAPTAKTKKSIEQDFLNDGELPDDVIIETLVMSTTKNDEPDVGFVHDEHTRMYPALVRLWVRAGDKASADQITDDLLATYMDVDTGEHGHVGVAERA